MVVFGTGIEVVVVVVVAVVVAVVVVVVVVVVIVAVTVIYRSFLVVGAFVWSHFIVPTLPCTATRQLTCTWTSLLLFPSSPFSQHLLPGAGQPSKAHALRQLLGLRRRDHAAH